VPDLSVAITKFAIALGDIALVLLSQPYSIDPPSFKNLDSAAKSRNEPQRTQRFPLYFFVIFAFFAVKKSFAVESSIAS
jgi:hypothetical protein